MRTSVPFSYDYKLVRRFGRISNYILYSSAAISTFTLGLFYLQLITIQIRNSINATLCALAVIYFLLDIIHSFLFHCSENKRRDDFIDNSLNTKLSEKNSTDYFTNENLSPGPLKLGINCFENSLFSMNISRKMLPEMAIKSGIIVLLFLLLSLYTNQSFIVIFLQMALPFAILKQTFHLLVFYLRVTHVFKEFIKIFSVTETVVRDHLIIHNVLNYESMLSWAGVQLSESIFDKLNPELSFEWNELKLRYNIPI